MKSCPSIEELILAIPNEWPDNLNLSCTAIKKITFDSDTDMSVIRKSLQSFPALIECDFEGCTIPDLSDDLTFSSKNNIKFIFVTNHADKPNLEKTFPNTIVVSSHDFKYPDYPSKDNAEPEVSLDNNINQGINNLTAKQVFENIDPSKYRICCYDTISITPESAILAKSTESLNIDLCELSKATLGAESYTGCIELNKNDWTVLPSLTMEDKLISIHSVPEIDLEIAFNHVEKLYYIRPKILQNNLPIVLSYTIEAE